MAYATAAELAASDFLSADLVLPSSAEQARLLSRASRLLDATVLMQAVYTVDDDGDPTDTDVIAALRDAACAQAAWWLETGDEQGVSAHLTGVNSGGGPSISGSLPRVAPDAVDVLKTATDSSGYPLLTGPWWP